MNNDKLKRVSLNEEITAHIIRLFIKLKHTNKYIAHRSIQIHTHTHAYTFQNLKIVQRKKVRRRRKRNSYTIQILHRQIKFIFFISIQIFK